MGAGRDGGGGGGRHTKKAAARTTRLSARRPNPHHAGWLGETYEGGANGGNGENSNGGADGDAASKSAGADVRVARLGPAADATGMHIISWSPRIMHYRRFLTEGACCLFLCCGWRAAMWQTKTTNHH